MSTPNSAASNAAAAVSVRVETCFAVIPPAIAAASESNRVGISEFGRWLPAVALRCAADILTIWGVSEPS